MFYKLTHRLSQSRSRTLSSNWDSLTIPKRPGYLMFEDMFTQCNNACTNVCTQLLDMFTPYLKDIRKNIQAEKVWIVKTFELIDSKINLFILIFLGVLWLDVSFLLLIHNCWYVQTSPLLLSSILLLILFRIFLTTVDD